MVVKLIKEIVRAPENFIKIFMEYINQENHFNFLDRVCVFSTLQIIVNKHDSNSISLNNDQAASDSKVLNESKDELLIQV